MNLASIYVLAQSKTTHDLYVVTQSYQFLPLKPILHGVKFVC